MICTPNIRQTVGRVQYICVVMTAQSQKEKKNRLSTDPSDKMISEAGTLNIESCMTVQKWHQNADITLHLGRFNARVRALISL